MQQYDPRGVVRLLGIGWLVRGGAKSLSSVDRACGVACVAGLHPRCVGYVCGSIAVGLGVQEASAFKQSGGAPGGQAVAAGNGVASKRACIHQPGLNLIYCTRPYSIIHPSSLHDHNTTAQIAFFFSAEGGLRL